MIGEIGIYWFILLQEYKTYIHTVFMLHSNTYISQDLGAVLNECEVYLLDVEVVIMTLAGGRLPHSLVPTTLLRFTGRRSMK